MATVFEYMQFATAVYAASAKNQIGAPSGWNALSWQADTWTGFSAGTFVRGNEVVIAYTGTNDWRDKVNWATGLGLPMPQVYEAMRYYFSVRQAYPTATITFTGHSLGGGLASLMAVFFDKQATVFDEAPFQVAAHSPSVLLAAAVVMLASGYVDGDFTAYLASVSLLALARESNVSNYYIEGEVLAQFRNAATALGNDMPPYEMGSSTASEDNRHSMALLTALEASPDFYAAVKRIPFLVTELMDTSLFAANNTDPSRQDILRHLLRHQLGVSGVTPDNMLDRFTEDVDRVTQAGGLTMSEEVLTKALIAFAMQMYIASTTDADKTLFSEVGGGIRFDRADIAETLSEIKGYPRYFAAFLATLEEEERDLITGKLPELRHWFIQAGGDAMSATAEEERAFMLGGKDDDTLTGGDQGDVLSGGRGDDTLEGNDGDDVLIGGDGDDTMNGGGGEDVLVGGDGDDTLDGGEAKDELKGGDGDDTLTGGQGEDLLAGGDGDDSMDGGEDDDELEGGKGDDHLAGAKGEDILLGGDGDDHLDGGEDDDVLEGEDGDDHLAGGTGDDSLLGGDGDDHLDGGEGVDELDGGDGDDTLVGGQGADTLVGGDGDDTLEGGEAGDDLDGGDGYDTYKYSSGGGSDKITDDDGEIVFNGSRLDGGKKKKDESVYRSSDKSHSYAWDGGDLLIDNTILVVNFNNRDLGFYLDEEDDDPEDIPDYDPDPPPPRIDPLVLDLDGNGTIDTIASTESSAFFDFNGDGIAERSGWIAPGDGLLVLDANDNGAIDNLSELFGTAEVSGFDDLRQRLDSNGDNNIDAGDEKFAHLRVWQDANGDGIAQAEEIQTLAQLGITSIGLDATVTSIADADNLIVATGTFQQNGEARLVGDVELTVNFTLTDSNPVRALNQDLKLDADIYRLPWLRGYGLVRTLPEAYQVDLPLRQAAAALAGQGAQAILAGFDAFFVKWSGLEAAHQAKGVTREELSIEDKVWMLETLIGRDTHKSAIGAAAFAPLDDSVFLDQAYINGKYSELVSRASLGFAMQSAGKDLLDGAYYSLAKDKFVASSAARLQARLQTRLNAITSEDEAHFAAMVLARLTADEVDLAAETMKQALSESAFAQIFFTALDFRGQHVSSMAEAAAFTASDNSGWFLVGSGGSDAIRGAAGDDVLIGGNGDDTLSGGAGKDTLSGGFGDDSLQGGAGNDLYLFKRGDGADSIYEQDAGGSNTDTLRFAEGITAGDVIVTRDQWNLYLRLANSSDRLTLESWFDGDGHKVEWVEFADGTVWSALDLAAAVAAPAEGADFLSGGSGNDVLAGLGGNDWIAGDAGDDTLDGGSGDDRLEGGAGNDVYLFERGHGADTISETGYGAGNTDTIRFGAGIAAGEVVVRRDAANLYLSLAGSADRLTVQYWFYGDSYKVERVEFADGTVWGVAELLAAAAVATEGADYLSGTGGNDVVTGLGGRDTLLGEAGDDTLAGGAGDDELEGGAGNDVYLFERGDGADKVYDYGSGAGNTDTIRFGAGIAAGDVIVRREQSSLSLQLAGSQDRLTVLNWFYSDGYKVERVEFADGTVWGVAELRAAAAVPSEGDDYLGGASGNDALTGLGGNDMLLGEGGDDTLDGGTGNDSLQGGAGNDVYLFARGDGADTVYDYGYGAGNTDTIRFGAGIAAGDVIVRREYSNLYLSLAGSPDRLTVQDWFYGDSYKVERVEFADGTVWGAAELLAAAVVPTEAADKLSGAGGNDALSGLGGNDTLIGDAGDDILDGGAGDDSLQGGAGNDAYLFERGDGADTIYDYGEGAGNTDTVRFGAGIAAQDVVVRRDYSNLYLGLAGSADRLALQYWFSSDSYKVERVEFADGTVWGVAELLAAAAVPTAGADFFVGTSGNDALTGLGGNDTLLGDAGHDTLDGGIGDDHLEGGAGNDVYLFERGDGADTVYDYGDGAGNTDTVRFGAGIAAEEVVVTRDQAHLYLSLAGSSDRLTLQSWFYGDGYKVERVEFADGTVWGVQELAAAVATPTAGDDFIDGTSGNDVLAGGDGDDHIAGGAGADIVYGGAGDDELDDSEGSNAIEGGDGNDHLYGYDSSDGGGAAPAYFFSGGKGNDTLYTQRGRYVVGFNAGDGQDTVDVRYLDGPLTLSLGGGISAGDLELSIDDGDVVVGTGGGDSIRLQALAATVQAYRAPMTLQIIGATTRTYDFNAVLAAFEAEFAQGAAGASWPLGAALASHGGATFTGQAMGGNLADRYAREGSMEALAPDAIRADLSSGQFGITAQHVSTEGSSVAGTASDDVLLGTDRDDILSGNAGNDTLGGGAGNDTFLFNLGDGVDRIVDAGGTDTIRFGAGIVSESLSLSLAPGALLLKVGSGGEGIHLNGFDPDNGLGSGVIEQLRFADGTVLSYEQLLARGFELSGSGAISGTALQEHITGSDGADTISGGKADDLLSAGAGDDTYLFKLGDGIDTLNDLATDTEGNRIVFGAGITRADLRFERHGSAVTLRYSAGDGIVLPQFDLSGANGSLVASIVEFADGSTVGMAELADLAAVALADHNGAIAAGGVLTLSAESLLANDTTAGGPSVIVGVAGRSAAGAQVSLLDGNLTYDTGSVFQSLAQGVSRTDTFTYTMAEAPGATATGAATVTVTVTGSNDAPIVAQALGDAAVLQGRLFRFTIPGSAFADVDSGDTLSYSVTAADGGALPGWLSYDAATATLRGRPANGDVGVFGIRVVATDSAGATASSTFAMTVIDVNDAPVLAHPIAAQSGVEDDLFSYTVAADAFADPDAGDTLSYSAQLANGDPLPAWLEFDAASRTFIGTPDANAIGIVKLRVTAADQRGYERAATFAVTVRAAPDKDLAGTSGNDTLSGSSGDDKLNGGAGRDTMRGKRGNDYYIVDNVNDSVIEVADEGTDYVEASVSFTLGANVEKLTLTGPLAINGTGNSLNNVLRGNSANNTLNGRAGADILVGGAGNDTYVVDNAGDLVMEDIAAGIDLVQSSLDYTLGANVENLTLTGSGAISGAGNALDNILTGNSAANALAGGAGNDTYVVDHLGDTVLENAAEGTDLVQSSVTFTLAANVENLTLTGTLAINGAGNDLDNFLTGNSGANVLAGGAGNDTLNGAAGADQLAGGAGDDIYVVDNAADVVLEFAGEGADVVQSSLTYTLGAELENLTLTGSGAINGTGNALANVLTGNSGNNVLNGGAGADTLAGGAGNDTYVVDDAGDAVSEGAGAGTDLVQSSVDYTLGADVENLTLTGTSAVSAVGNALANVITGNSADNLIDGSGGADTLAGGAGNDSYVVDHAGDVVLENAGEGTDLVQARVTYTLGSNVENLSLTGSAAASGTGNTLNNVILGNGADNILNGAAGADTLAGGDGNDTYVVDNVGDVVLENAGEGTDLVQSSLTYTLGAELENLTLTGTLAINGTGNAFDNVLSGNSGVNTLTGGAGNDNLNGGAGADQLAGGSGDDAYVVDNSGDVVLENAGEGADLVLSSVTYTLAGNVEKLTLTGTGAINATGNTLANVLTGNSGINTLNGGAGADTLAGAAGNDTYVVDDLGDSVLESVAEGSDLVQSSVTFSLGANVENLTLTGTLAINGAGNELDNVLVGNAGANILTGGDGNDTLNGGAGADQMAGGAGDDVYVVDNAGDVVLENGGDGADLVQSGLTYALGAEIENLTLTGSGAINGSGNALANILTGNSGNNVLNGGAGADTLAGGAGNDTYVVDAEDTVSEGVNAGTDLVQSSIDYTLGANVENLTLTGTGAVSGTGNALANVLTGNSAANALAGGAGNDTYVVDHLGDTVLESAAEGTDLVQSSVTFTLGADVENLTLTGTLAINGTGNELDNVLAGNSGANALAGGAGNDTLNGAAGADQMAGGLGDDIYVVDNAGDVALENAGEGTDLVQSGVTFTLGSEIENLTLTGSGALNGTGNALANLLTGNSGNNALNGGAGADTLAGGAGNDTYVVDAEDTVSEGVNAGTDLVQSSVNYTLGANVENLTLTGTGAVSGTGNALANILTGNSAANALAGGAGDDTYVVDHLGDTVLESAAEGTDLVQSSVTFTLGADVENLTLTGTLAINGTGNELDNVLTGNSGANALAGGAGNDTLNGAAGADQMAGGLGDDIYVVDNAGDVALEYAGEGSDLVQSSLTYTLGADVDNLTLTGSGAINGTGNALDNVLTGNSGVNILTGGAGNDTLNGAAGADRLAGGTGDDLYVVDNVGDVVTEYAGEGADLVQSSVTYTLAANLDSLTLTGTLATNGTGNAGDNLIKGNGGNNSLDGGVGNDILQAGAGADILTDLTGNNLLDGGAGNDTLAGGAGNDCFIGGTGNDTITTGTGADVLAFDRGDGQDIVNASTGSDNTIALGGGITYADLLFNKSGNDLVLATGAGEQVTFRDWYASVDNHSVANLQIVIEGSADYVPGAGNQLNNNKIEQFNFDGLVAAFDQARTLTPFLTNWALSSSLLNFYLSSSDTAAIGGDLAYQYAKFGNLSNLSVTQVQGLLADVSFGTAAHNLQGAAASQDTSLRLL